MPIRPLAALLAVLLLAPLAPAQGTCTTDDAFEDSDVCGSAALMPMGDTPDLVVHGANSPLGLDDDVWRVEDVPSGQYANIRFFALDAGDRITVSVYDDAACTNLVDFDDVPTVWKTVHAPNTTGAPKDFWVVVEYQQGYRPCAQYQLRLQYFDGFCSWASNDSFEPNDDCASAAALTDGIHGPLWILDGDVDHYEITVPAGDSLLVDQLFEGPFGEFSLELFEDAACTVPASDPALDGLGIGGNTVGATNTTGAAKSYYVRTELLEGECFDYRLHVHLSGESCPVGLADDALEDNDDCASAAALAPGLHPGLVARTADSDFYAVTAPPTCLLRARVEHTPGVFTELGMGPADDCATEWYFDNGSGGTLEFGLFLDDAVPQDVVVRVEAAASSIYDPFRCVEYDLWIEALEVNDDATSYCFADGTVPCPCGNDAAAGAETGCVNSTGVGASLTPYGSSSFAADDLVLRVDGATTLQTGVLFEGSQPASAPFRDGKLCAGGFTKRIENLFLGAGFGASTVSIAENFVPGPGVSRHYQVWYRDPNVSVCGTGSNLTNGVRIDWQ